LKKNTLVATVMSNLGLDFTLRQAGGQTVRTQVGDRYVLEKMLADDLNVGGEQSGHVIFRDFATTGDGLVAALQVLRIMMDAEKRLSELRQVMTKFPQLLVNVRVREKPAWDTMPEVLALVKAAEQQLGTEGRVLLRYSGTEPKARLLIEGRDQKQIQVLADGITGKIRARIGG
jgi:phosphoglucosamine mutase